MSLIARRVLADVGEAMASSSTPSQQNGSNLISGMTLLLLCLFILFFLICFLCTHSLRRHTHTVEFGHGNHPTQGLAVTIIETLPKVIFTSSIHSQKKEMMECAICLEDFSEQEMLRLLPHCGHSFHLECINMWLLCHTTCPLCRHSLLQRPDVDTKAIDMVSNNVDVERGQNEEAAMAAGSIAAAGVLQMRVQEKPKNCSEEEGESSENRPIQWGIPS